MTNAIELCVLVICFNVFPNVNGCGVIPTGQERTINFIVSDFKLPAVMAYSGDPVARTKAATISTSKDEAQTFVRRLIMEPVEEVLYEQGRSAFLPDNVISLILQQINIQISYEPLNCEHVIDLMGAAAGGMMVNCIISDGIITNICMGAAQDACMMNMIAANTKPIPPMHFSISGSLKTTNAVMVNWSNQMWQSILNRVLRRITSGPNGSNFFGASVNIR